MQADEKAKAKNLKQAKVCVWLGVLGLIVGGLCLCDELLQWQNGPTVRHAFHLVSHGGVILFSSSLRTDAQKIIRRSGEEYKSWGQRVGFLLIGFRPIGNALCDHYPQSVYVFGIIMTAALFVWAVVVLTGRMEQKVRLENREW